MQITPLEGAGAEITGADIRNLTGEEFAAIRKVYAEHGVIFFRDQSLTEEDHIAFARRWGPININRFFLAHDRHPEIALVLKEKEQTSNIGGGWHTDHSYDAEPAMGSVLVARQLPDSGGDTWFASMYAAYDTLDAATRNEIASLRAVHSAKHIFGSQTENFYRANEDTGNRIGNSAAADLLEDVTHPVVITHPLSGKKALYVNPAFTIAIAGYSEEASKELLTRLYTHAMNPAHAHRFKWREGSVAFWDNRSTWHWAMNDYHGHRRLMHRITIEGGPLN